MAPRRLSLTPIKGRRCASYSLAVVRHFDLLCARACRHSCTRSWFATARWSSLIPASLMRWRRFSTMWPNSPLPSRWRSKSSTPLMLMWMCFQLVCYDGETDFSESLIMEEASGEAPPHECRAVQRGMRFKVSGFTALWRRSISFVVAQDTVLFIYTSGTTGLPKAAKVTHNRYEQGAIAFSKMYNISRCGRASPQQGHLLTMSCHL